jgi:teichuronic acid biosynthesis glycosyltransferase TuaC
MPRPVRVLFVTNMWPDHERPWYGSFVHSQARSLSDLGVDVDVLPIRGYARKWEYLTAAGKMSKHNFEARYDVIHAHYGHSALVARCDVRRPLVISYCGDDLLGTPSPAQPSRMTPGSRLLARSFAQVARLASATITKSEQMMLELPARLRLRNHVIPNGVDLEMFKRIDQAEARRRLGWDPSETVVLFVGNPAIARKNHALAERAVQVALARCSSLRLRVAKGVAPDQIPIWMSAADVLVHPSWSEGSPNVVKEAMACELPIVATPAGDVPERLRGVVGCHVLPGDDLAFADALLDAVSHHPCAAARGAVGDLSLARVAQRIVGVYESVTAVHRPPG